MTRSGSDADPPQTASHSDPNLMIYGYMQHQSKKPPSVAQDLPMSARLKQKHNTGI
jgi:hypothetical protein